MVSNASPQACNHIQSTHNSDIQGFAVKLSCVVAQICLGILVTWSPPEARLQDLAHLFLLQSYPVILSTFLSLGRAQLSLSDVTFTVFFTVYSPMGLYFFFSNARDLWRNWRRTFTRPQISRLPRRVLLLLMPLMIFILSAVTVNPHALTDSQCPTTETYSYTRGELIASEPGLFAPFVFVLFYIVYTVRHFKDILIEARRRANSNIWVKHKTNLRSLQFAMLYPFAWINASWVVVVHSHPWVVIFPVMCGYTLWSVSMRAFHIEPGYVFSYGQILAMFTVVQPVLQTLTLVYDRQQDIWCAFKRFPQAFRDGCVFLATGQRNPWKPDQEEGIALYAPAESTIPISLPTTVKPGLSPDTTAALMTTQSQWQRLPDDDPDAQQPASEPYIASVVAANTIFTDSPPTVDQSGLSLSDTTSAFLETKNQYQILPDEDPDTWRPVPEQEIAVNTAADTSATISPPTTSLHTTAAPVVMEAQWQKLSDGDLDAPLPGPEEYIPLDAATNASIMISSPTAGQSGLSRSDTTSALVVTTVKLPDENLGGSSLDLIALDAAVNTTITTSLPTTSQLPLPHSHTTSALLETNGERQKSPDDDPGGWPLVRGQSNTRADTTTILTLPPTDQPELFRSDTLLRTDMLAKDKLPDNRLYPDAV